MPNLTRRRYSDPDKGRRKLVDIANSIRASRWRVKHESGTL
jgi:hypothetical protein